MGGMQIRIRIAPHDLQIKQAPRSPFNQSTSISSVRYESKINKCQGDGDFFFLG